VAFKTGAAPTNVAARAGTKSVVVSWTPVTTPGATYHLKRSESAATPGVDLAAVIVGTSFVDLTVVLGATYYYQVSADDGNGSIGTAAPVAVTVMPASAATPRLIPSGTTGIGKVPVGTGTQVTAPPGLAPDTFSVSGGPGGTMIFPWPANLQAVVAAGASSITVSRWFKSNPDCCRLMLPEPDLYYIDAFGPSDPFGTYVYRMTINYSDGSQGFRDATFNRVHGQGPVGFTATPDGSAAVQLSFVAPLVQPGNDMLGTLMFGTDYLVSGPGVPGVAAGFPPGQILLSWWLNSPGSPGWFVDQGTFFSPSFSVPKGAGTWTLTPVFYPSFRDTSLTLTAKAVIP
jgi:hypothetical protein